MIPCGEAAAKQACRESYLPGKLAQDMLLRPPCIVDIMHH